MTHAEKTKAMHQHNNELVAAMFKTNIETTAVWKYERGVEFIASQAGHTTDFTQELEASKAFWAWFTYEWDKFNSRFMMLYFELVTEWNNGSIAARKSLCANYTEDVTDWLAGEAMAYAYANFIGEYIDSLPVTVKTKNNHK